MDSLVNDAIDVGLGVAAGDELPEDEPELDVLDLDGGGVSEGPHHVRPHYPSQVPRVREGAEGNGLDGTARLPVDRSLESLPGQLDVEVEEVDAAVPLQLEGEPDVGVLAVEDEEELVERVDGPPPADQIVIQISAPEDQLPILTRYPPPSPAPPCPPPSFP